MHQQVVEIHRVVVAQKLLVSAVNPFTNFLHVAIGLHGFGRDEGVFPAADLSQYCPGIEPFFVEIHLLKSLANERQLVGGVVDHPIALEADRLHFYAQDACTDGVKRADGQSAKVGPLPWF